MSQEIVIHQQVHDLLCYRMVDLIGLDEFWEEVGQEVE